MFFDFLIPRDSRTVKIQRRTAGELVGPVLDVASPPEDVAAVILAAAEPTHELRIWGTPRALRRIGATGPERDARGIIWSFLVRHSPERTQWITCYEGTVPK